MFYSFLRRAESGVVFEGFDQIEDCFMAHIASDVQKVYLDGTIRPESFGSVFFQLSEINGKQVCCDPVFLMIADRFQLYDRPYFLLENRLYALSRWNLE